MAERFPSLDEFDAGHTEVKAAPSGADDGTSFLDRERAALGDDADQFASPNDNLASVEDAVEDDLIGGDSGHFQDAEDIAGFESSFPAIDNTNDHMPQGGAITGTTYTAPAYTEPEEEPEVIKEWRERRNEAMQQRDKRSDELRAESVKKAQQEIDDFYESYNVKKDKSIAQTRRDAEEFLASRDDTTAGGTSWERIAKLIDLTGNPKKTGATGSGKERFREMLLSLRKDEKAPGASGY